MTMYSEDEFRAFEILEIEPTEEESIIKRAYARMTRKIHPEENPDEWRNIRFAYEILMQDRKYREAEDLSEIERTNENTFSSMESEDSLKQGDFKSELEETVDDIADASVTYKQAFMMLEKMLELLKKVPSLTKSFYEKNTIDAFAFQTMRENASYYDALIREEFIDELTYVMKNCSYDESYGLQLLEDIKKSEEEKNVPEIIYAKLKQTIENKIEEAGKLKAAKYDFKIKADGDYDSKLYPREYLLRDFSRVGVKHAVYTNTRAIFDEKHFVYYGELVIGEEKFGLVVLEKKFSKIFTAYQLYHQDYESPEECIKSIKKIREYYESFYRENKALMLLRKFAVAIAIALVVLSVIAIPVTAFFNMLSVGFLLVLVVVGVIYCGIVKLFYGS